MTPKNLSLTTALACLCLSSCTKKTNPGNEASYHMEYLQNRLNIGMIGYDSTELTTIVVKKFLPDGTFTSLVDSAICTPISGVTNWSYYSTGGVPSPTANDSLISPNYTIINVADTAYIQYDYEIVIPSNQRVYKLAAVTFSGNGYVEMPTCCPVELSARNASYTLSGQSFANEAPLFFEGVYVWLQK